MKLVNTLQKKASHTLTNLLPGRETPMPLNGRHAVLGGALAPPYPDFSEQALFGMGCFWGVERLFWQVSGVITTAVGYSGGGTRNPTYEEVCTGRTGHNEVVRIIFDPSATSYGELLTIFWESHNPTQGMRQGNDLGTQYRSGIYYFDDAQRKSAEGACEIYQRSLTEAGFGRITTEIIKASTFYFAEDYHQQYLHKNPAGYCGMGGTGVKLSGAAALTSD